MMLSLVRLYFHEHSNSFNSHVRPAKHMGEISSSNFLALSVDWISGDLDRTGSQLRIFPSFYIIAQSKCQSNFQFSCCFMTIDGKNPNYHKVINDLIPYTDNIKREHFKIIQPIKSMSLKEPVRTGNVSHLY